MNTSHASNATRFKVGVFTLVGLVVTLFITSWVNDKPLWWHPCQLVKINVEDATGLKKKSPIRSLGIEIGYLNSVMLYESHVSLGICLTSPVEVLPTTRAYIRGEGFLGDKFVELKPIKYLGPRNSDEKTEGTSNESTSERAPFQKKFLSGWLKKIGSLVGISEVQAAPAPASPIHEVPIPKKSLKGGREIPVGEASQDIQHLVNRVDELVNHMSGLTDNLKQAIGPDELKKTMRELNRTLENASKTISPEGGLNQTAQRTLAKLEDSIEQLRDLMTRVNKGEGSVGMLLNDPIYAEEIRMAIKNVNHLLNKVGEVRFVVDLGGANLTGYNGGRGWFQLGIWPKKDRYYLLGVSSDPRGRISNTTVTTTAGGITQTTQTQVVDQTGLLLTAMLGKVFLKRIDLSVGVLYGDGAASINFLLGPHNSEDRIQLRNDFYVRNSAGSLDDRISLTLMPFANFYLRAGLESFKGYPSSGQTIFSYGAGVTFDDEDIKLLFAFR